MVKILNRPRCPYICLRHSILFALCCLLIVQCDRLILTNVLTFDLLLGLIQFYVCVLLFVDITIERNVKQIELLRLWPWPHGPFVYCFCLIFGRVSPAVCWLEQCIENKNISSNSHIHAIDSSNDRTLACVTHERRRFDFYLVSLMFDEIIVNCEMK